MIELKLNNEKALIPTYKELTVRQLIRLKGKDNLNIINYLSSVIDRKFADIAELRVKNPYDLAIRIGKYKDYTKSKYSKVITIPGKKFWTKNLEIETLGQRFMIEENAKNLKDEEYICFVLAVAILGTEMDSSKIIDLKEKIMDEPYLNVLPIGFFLHKSLWIGSILETNNSKMLMDSTNIMYKKNRLGLMILRVTLIFMKFKRWLNC